MLRHYNRGVSNEFIQKNIAVLKGGYTFEDFEREMDESAERRKRAGDECREALNASWKRIDEFDRKFQEKEAFKNRVLGWFLSILLTITGVRIGWELLKVYVLCPSSRVNDVPLAFNRAWNLENKGFFVDMIRNYIGKVIFMIMLLMLLPGVISFVIRLLFSIVRVGVRKVSGSFSEGLQSVKSMFEKEEEDSKEDSKG